MCKAGYVRCRGLGGNVMSIMFVGQSLTDTVFDDFSGDAAARWDFVADGVMGGVSSGSLERFDAGLRLHGMVSTRNNGGFIQMRRRFSEPWSKDESGLRLSVRGNGARYYVFLKTPGLARVWHSFRAAFDTTESWQDIDIPFDMFAPSHMGMPAMVRPSEVNSIAIVAYGDDYEADVSVREIRLY